MGRGRKSHTIRAPSAHTGRGPGTPLRGHRAPTGDNRRGDQDGGPSTPPPIPGAVDRGDLADGHGPGRGGRRNPLPDVLSVVAAIRESWLARRDGFLSNLCRRLP